MDGDAQEGAQVGVSGGGVGVIQHCQADGCRAFQACATAAALVFGGGSLLNPLYFGLGCVYLCAFAVLLAAVVFGGHRAIGVGVGGALQGSGGAADDGPLALNLRGEGGRAGIVGRYVDLRRGVRLRAEVDGGRFGRGLRRGGVVTEQGQKIDARLEQQRHGRQPADVGFALAFQQRAQELLRHPHRGG